MAKFNFCGPSYTSQSLTVDAQKLMNWYLEKIESGDGNTDFALYPSPGTKTFIQLNPPAPPVSASGLQNLRVVLSAAQLNSASQTGIPILLIPAQGPNLVIVPIFFILQYHFVSVPYSGTSGLDPFIGLGSTLADIQNTQTLFMQTPPLKQTFDTLQCSAAIGTFASSAPEKSTNQPLQWIDDNLADGLGDGIITLNIQFFVLNIVTGKIINGQPKRVFGSKVELSTSQLKNAFATPVQILAAPGNPNQMLVPLTAIVWHHFNTAPFGNDGLPQGGYGTSSVDTLHTPIFRNFDSNSFLLSADSMEQEQSNFCTNNIGPAKFLNQPISWVNRVNISGTSGDATATVYVQYLVVDVTTGALLQGGGDLQNTLTNVTNAQIKNAVNVAVPIAPAPGANLLNVTWYAVAQSVFHTTAFSGGLTPDPGIAPSSVVPEWANPIDVSHVNWQAASNQLATIVSSLYTNFDLLQVPPAMVINQPLTWTDVTDMHASPSDSSGIANTQYIILDTNTGLVIGNP